MISGYPIRKPAPEIHGITFSMSQGHVIRIYVHCTPMRLPSAHVHRVGNVDSSNYIIGSRAHVVINSSLVHQDLCMCCHSAWTQHSTIFPRIFGNYSFYCSTHLLSTLFFFFYTNISSLLPTTSSSQRPNKPSIRRTEPFTTKN